MGFWSIAAEGVILALSTTNGGGFVYPFGGNIANGSLGDKPRPRLTLPATLL